ncbi:PrsW family glutamic-type intramembrane protease [Lactiplantibacillus pentosus]|jgi:RsiW-degrading membrane proteinase PrsW (M82 family)|uniref:PrsW family glutamic-type intramembrane protease n=1 Tax=Lactiplantibacillus pentosus TaxID=1589 RepID=UPI000B543834|nr:PrsW family intramembrane metalloprotease [Lactiplantibacillus pentosus]ASG80290.1 PrsW family intramembrane metalloprotease [Lactiplantibacillus pentosus]MCB5220859.1 PrsW family intramembrane metalloprotease [Lactiplantibacillus pentosus]MCT3289549.1 PrsW family intramembrane metalloprotease [Lactiplantibacillus pentosus]MDO7805605.1 PrsW family intramembrane metalloprotease [Lactiplantibacillus pentosus]WFC02793.1 PrsW family intramembrane metalloprotease [Lactiplantibacillus pentosus]
MKYCPHCGNPVRETAKFCPSCGQALNNTGQAVTTPGSNSENNQIKGFYDSATAKLSHYTGEEGAVKVNIGDLFSEVFKHHTKDEANSIFIAGTKTTTPALADVSDEWAKPWLFSRILLGFLLAFAALLYMADSFDNSNAIPGLIMVGAFAVPFSGLVFFFEANAFKDISLFEIVKVFFIGGIFSLVVTLFLYQFVSFSAANQIFGVLTLKDSLAIGLVEELGKVLIVSYFISQLDVHHILDGILIGAAVGAGFAAFETAGYIYNAGTNDLVAVAILRGWSAIGGHLVWAAIAGGAIMIVKRDQPFKFSQLLDTRFLVFFILAVLMHATWDWDVTVLGSDYLKLILLIVLAWIVVFVLMNAGLKEISHLKQQAQS